MSKGNITLAVSNPLELSIPRNTVDLIITQVPAVGSQEILGLDSAQTINTTDIKKYLKDLRKLTDGLYSVLKPGGSLIISTGKFLDLSKQYVVDVLEDKKFVYNGDIVELSNLYFEGEEMIEQIQYDKARFWHHFSKGQPYFNPFEMRKNNSPVWPTNPDHSGYKSVEWLSETYPSVINEIAPDIAERFVLTFSKPNALVVDIFGGTGAVAMAAASNNRNVISSDPNSDVIKPAKLRTTLSMGERFLNERVKVVI